MLNLGPAYNSDPLQDRARIAHVRFAAGGPRRVYLPVNNIPALPITGVEAYTAFTLRRDPFTGNILGTYGDLSEVLLTLVNTDNEMVIEQLPLTSLAQPIGAAPPAGVTWRRKVFRLHNIDPLRSYLDLNAVPKAVNIVLEFRFGP